MQPLRVVSLSKLRDSSDWAQVAQSQQWAAPRLWRAAPRLWQAAPRPRRAAPRPWRAAPRPWWAAPRPGSHGYPVALNSRVLQPGPGAFRRRIGGGWERVHRDGRAEGSLGPPPVVASVNLVPLLWTGVPTPSTPVDRQDPLPIFRCPDGAPAPSGFSPDHLITWTSFSPHSRHSAPSPWPPSDPRPRDKRISAHWQ